MDRLLASSLDYLMLTRYTIKRRDDDMNARICCVNEMLCYNIPMMQFFNMDIIFVKQILPAMP